MKVREKLRCVKGKLREWHPLQRVTQTRFCIRFCRTARMCMENPFPLLILLTLVYRLLLDVLYIKVLSPAYSYVWMTVDIFPLQYLCSWLAVIVLSPFIAELNLRTSASSITVTLLNFIYFIPMTAYCGCKGTTNSLLLVSVIYWTLLLLWQFRIPVLRLAPVSARYASVMYSLLTVFSALLILFVSGRYTGFRVTFQLREVYEIRSEAAGYAIPGIFNYALSTMSVVLAVLLMYWLVKKKYLISLGIIVVFWLYYSISATKSIFMLLFLALGCVFFFRPWMYRWISGLASLGVIASVLEKKLLGSDQLLFMAFYRVMMLPAQLAENAADFFGTHPLNLFRDGILGKFSFDSIYSAKIQNVLGEQSCYPESFANVGLVGDLYVNLPILLGLVLMPLVIVLCLRLLDLVSQDTMPKLLFAVCVYFAYQFSNMSWSTVLLTAGFMLACLLLYFFPKEEVPHL